MRELKLENSDRVALVDDEDYNRAAVVKWYLNKKTGYVYGYFGGQTKLLIHRFIMGLPGLLPQVDHKNDNPLDNTRENLRLCTNRQNSGNTSKRSTNKSGYKGVCWSDRYGKWRATITDHGKQRHIGYFDSDVAAAKAYDKHAVEVFGEFARLNFPNGDASAFDDGIKRMGQPKSSRVGVHQSPAGRWIARAKVSGDRVYLGSFGTEQEAVNAVDAAEKVQ